MITCSVDRFIKRLPNKKDDSKKPSTPTGTSEEIISSSGSAEASCSSKTNLESSAKNQKADNPILEANLSTPGSSKTHEEQSSSKRFKLAKETGPSTTSLRKKKTNRAPLKFVSSKLNIPDFKGWLVKSTQKKVKMNWVKGVPN
ncbi:uncharacterized protein LOC128999639 [Macrosteles quadrilineatus]|uniref:uncharacterized protein LOC128999639 n=1 Tax=Macrosteles quadrilineatus TaxID=74068 RepID=UPI0023E0FA2F|nr:uncharacterized protein LOC128999639 [Macrosteles quadrilineatus]